MEWTAHAGRRSGAAEGIDDSGALLVRVGSTSSASCRGELLAVTMLLAIDVGNTNIVIGVFEGDRLAQSWRLATLRERTADELGILVTHLFDHERVDRTAVDGMIMASVVPPLTGTAAEMARDTSGASR